MPLFSFSRRPNVQELKSHGDVNGLIEALDYGGSSPHTIYKS